MPYILLALVLLAGPVRADTQPWVLITERQGVKVSSRPVPGSDLLEFRGEAIFPLAAHRIWDVIRNVPDRVEFMPYLVDTRILGPAGGNAFYVYEHIDPPLIKPRDYTLRVEYLARPDGSYVCRWTIANDKGPPEQPGILRLDQVSGSWTLEPLTADATRLIYRVHSSPGGGVPRWISNRANRTSIPDLFDAIRNRAENPAWRRN